MIDHARKRDYKPFKTGNILREVFKDGELIGAR